MATRHLVVGAGPAGINAVQTLRAIEAESQITLVCDEPAYARMVLPYYLEGKIDERAVMTGDDSWFKELGVSTQLSVRVNSVDPSARRVASTFAAPMSLGSRSSRPESRPVSKRARSRPALKSK